MVESQPSKLLVAGSIPVSRSSLCSRELPPKRELRLGNPVEGCLAVPRSAKADVAQLAERVLGKDEVTSSILVIGSNLRTVMRASRAPVGTPGEGCPPWRAAPRRTGSERHKRISDLE